MVREPGGHWISLDSDGEYHSFNDCPAVIQDSGTLIWYKHGWPHRDGGRPAVCHADGTTDYYIDGVEQPAPAPESPEREPTEVEPLKVEPIDFFYFGIRVDFISRIVARPGEDGTRICNMADSNQYLVSGHADEHIAEVNRRLLRIAQIGKENQ